MSSGMTEMEQNSIFKLFYDSEPISLETINTSHGDSDFREVVIANTASDEKYIIRSCITYFPTASYHEVSDEQKKMFAQEQETLGTCPNCDAQVVKGKFGAYCKNKCA